MGDPALQRVKVYRLNEEGLWDDKGTGHVSVELVEVRLAASVGHTCHAADWPVWVCTAGAAPYAVDAVIRGCDKLMCVVMCGVCMWCCAGLLWAFRFCSCICLDRLVSVCVMLDVLLQVEHPTSKVQLLCAPCVDACHSVLNCRAAAWGWW